MIDIIINPTKKCNFCCDFCAASEIPNDEISIEDTIKILEKYQREYGIRTIIINGGDRMKKKSKEKCQILQQMLNFTSLLQQFRILLLNSKRVFLAVQEQ